MGIFFVFFLTEAAGITLSILPLDLGLYSSGLRVALTQLRTLKIISHILFGQASEAGTILSSPNHYTGLSRSSPQFHSTRLPHPRFQAKDGE